MSDTTHPQLLRGCWHEVKGNASLNDSGKTQIFMLNAWTRKQKISYIKCHKGS